MMSSSRITSSSSPCTFTVCPEYLPNRILSPTFTDIGRTLPSSSSLPVPTATTSPVSGFSAAVSGMTMPDAVLRSSSRRFTMTRSCNGRIFIFQDLLKSLRTKELSISTHDERVLILDKHRAEFKTLSTFRGRQGPARTDSGQGTQALSDGKTKLSEQRVPRVQYRRSDRWSCECVRQPAAA